MLLQSMELENRIFSQEPLCTTPKKMHTDSHVIDCGLLVSKSNPISRATLDAKVSCSCCGTGLVELNAHTLIQ